MLTSSCIRPSLLTMREQSSINGKGRTVLRAGTVCTNGQLHSRVLVSGGSKARGIMGADLPNIWWRKVKLSTKLTHAGRQNADTKLASLAKVTNSMPLLSHNSYVRIAVRSPKSQ